ncbi:metallophosphoesterase [Methylobacterium sp. P31]
MQVTTYRLRPRHWPSGLRLRIAVLTDFHAHPQCMGAAEIASVVAQTNALAPDLILLLGDYGSQSPDPVPFETVAGLLRGLRAPKGVYAIQGNHDWGDDCKARQRGHGPTRAERALRAAGISFIENATVRLDLPAPIWLAGLESEETPRVPQEQKQFDNYRRDVLARTLLDVPPDGHVLLLAHEPDIFALGLDPRIILTLSGHTRRADSHSRLVALDSFALWFEIRLRPHR